MLLIGPLGAVSSDWLWDVVILQVEAPSHSCYDFLLDFPTWLQVERVYSFSPASHALDCCVGDFFNVYGVVATLAALAFLALVF